MANKAASKITPEDVARNGHVVVFLRREMEARQWGASDLVKALGLDRGSTAIYPWIKGTSSPGHAMRLKLGELFKVAPETFAPRDPGEHLPVHQPGTFKPPTRPSDVLSFVVGSDGTARIKLDATLSIDKAMPLLRMLLDAGVVFSGGENETSH